MTATITCSPPSILSGGTVRFNPTVVSSYPVVSYAWDFGDSSTSTDACPIHTYGSIASRTTYTISLTATDSNGATHTATSYVYADIAANVPSPSTTGTYHQVSVLIYDDTDAMLVNRSAWAGSHYYLLYPKTQDQIDKIGTATFSLLDLGDATATEHSLKQEGRSVLFIMGNNVTFSGRIRRVTQNTQNGYDTATRVKIWDVECDSDLVRLQSLKIPQSVMNQYGNSLYGSAGYIASLILTPNSGEGDIRGNISSVDTRIYYNLNTTTYAEDVGSKYEHLMNLLSQTNYDLQCRSNDLYIQYATYAAGVLTITGASFTTDEFIGKYVLFCANGTQKGVFTYGVVTGNTADTITITPIGGSNALSTNGYVLLHKGYVVDFGQDLSQPVAIKNLSINKDVFEFSDNDDKRKLSTKVSVSGKSSGGNTIYVTLAASHEYDIDAQYYKDSTFVTYKTDGVVYKNGYNTGGTSYNLPLGNNEVWLYGWDYAITTGLIIIMSSPFGTSYAYTVGPVIGNYTDRNGVRYTRIGVASYGGGLSYLTSDLSGGGILFCTRIYVDDYSKVGTNEVRVGEEVLTVNSTGTDPTYGDYIQTLDGVSRSLTSSTKAYAHGVGALVARTNYTESSPETGSPVDLYGLYIDNRTVDNIITYADLDTYATTLLLGLGNFYRKATTWGLISLDYVPVVGTPYASYTQPNKSSPPRLSDRLSFTEYTGGSATEYQIVGITIDYDKMSISYELGDYEKNVFTSTLQSTNSINRTLT